jgi:hypothetical protein
MKSSLWLLTSALILGCGDDCTDIGCGPAFLVELRSEAWQDGEYTVAIDAGDDSTTCSFTLDGSEATTGTCEPDVANVDTSELADGFVLVRYQDAKPRELQVSIEHGGEELASDGFEPEYEEVDVSPDACGGTCTAAQVSLEVPGASP